MKNKFYFFAAILSLFALMSCASTKPVAQPQTVILEEPQTQQIEPDVIAVGVISALNGETRGNFIRGIHLSAYAVATQKSQNAVIDLMNSTELNAVVIDVKEIDGAVCVPGVKTAIAYGTSRNVIPNLQNYLARLKEEGVYTIARLVVFRDGMIGKKIPALTVKDPDGNPWVDRKNMMWLDPYNKQAWDYILEIAEAAADMGFDEIQFDYIRFPSDGNLKLCRYSNPNHTHATASKALVDFLKEANKRLHAKGVKISIDVFGLTTTATDDMGIGQKLVEMAEWVDYVSPMTYPSHYYNDTYNIPVPNKAPYTTVYKSMEGATRRIPPEKMRPWLQDFSMFGVKYGPEQVRAQMQACYDNGVGDWILWNASCKYTKDALLMDGEEHNYKKNEIAEVKQIIFKEVGKNIKIIEPKVEVSTTTSTDKAESEK